MCNWGIVGFDVGVHHAASYGAPVATSDATHEVIVTTDVTDYIEVVNAAFGINRAE